MKKIFIGALGVLSIFGTAAGWIATAKKKNDLINYKDFRINKFKMYFDVTNEWVRLKNQGKNLDEFFVKNGWSDIAIYGVGELGNRLLEELKGSSVTVKYAIDEHTDNVFSDMEVKEPNGELTPVDVIVVTPFFEYEKIEEKLMNLVEYPVVSIEDIIFSMQCYKNKPGLFIVDTPQHGLNQGNDDDNPESMKHGLFTYLIEHKNIGQTIIVENIDHLPDIDFEGKGINIVDYTHDNYESKFRNNRYGFLIGVTD